LSTPGDKFVLKGKLSAFAPFVKVIDKLPASSLSTAGYKQRNREIDKDAVFQRYWQISPLAQPL
jgi:hypothetical protein